MKWNYSPFSKLSDNSQLCHGTHCSGGKCGIHFSFKKSLESLPCRCFQMWNILPSLWKDKSFQGRRIILPLVEYNKTRGIFPLWEFVTFVRQFPTIHTTHGHGTFPSQPTNGGFPFVTSRAANSPFNCLWQNFFLC